MRTLEDMVTQDLKRYMAGGYSLEGAARQAKALRQGNWNQHVDAAVKKIKDQLARTEEAIKAVQP